MSRRAQVQLIAAIVVLVFSGEIWITGGNLNPQWLRFYSAAVFVAVAVLTLWDRILWHLPPMQRIKSVPRDLRGTWKGEVESTWVDPDKGTATPKKTVYLVVRQTSMEVSATMITDEAVSRSSLADVRVEADHQSFEYLYVGKPDNSLQKRSRIHQGSASLEVSGRPASRLKGHYWTDRDTRGEMKLTARVSAKADDFESAGRLFS